MMELIYDNKFMFDFIQGLNYYNKKNLIDKNYIHTFKINKTLINCYKEVVFTLYCVSKDSKEEVLTYKENVKVENNTLDLSHFKNEVFYQLFDYIIKEYDKFKV